MEGMFFLLLALYALLKVFMQPLTVFNNPTYPGRKALVAAVSRQEDPLSLKSESCSHE